MKKHNFLLRALCRCMTGGGLFVFIAVCLCSCENFLDGAEVKKNLNDAINYINAESCLIGVDFADGSGVLNKPAGGETEKKEGEYFSLDFDVSDKYEFIRWEVKDSVSGKVYENGEYIGIDDVYSSDTECCFIKCPPAGGRLTLTSVTGKRPGWLSRSPEIESELSIKNMSINVTFDQEMDEESIYYNEDELKEIKGTYGPESILCTFVDGKEKYYGYIDEGGQTHFKNISISSNILKNNLAGCFKAPVFESPTVLSIAAHASQAEGDVLSNYDEILVEISDGFFYKKEGKNVALSDSIKWIYQIGNQIDSEAPSVSTCEVKGAGEVLFVPASEVPAHSKDKIPSLNFTDGTKLHFNISVADSGTGSAANFTLMLKKLYEDDYNTQSDSKELEKKYTFPFASRQFGLIDKDVDLYEELGIKESGLYSLYFKFRDRAGYEKIWPENDKKYYFVLDMKAPDFLEPPEVVEDSPGNYTASWSESQSIDYKNPAIRLTNLSTGGVTETAFEKGSVKASFSVEEGVSYEASVLFYDYAGNANVQFLKILRSVEVTGTPEFVVPDVFDINQRPSYYGLTVTACYLDGTAEDVSDRASFTDSPRKTASAAHIGCTVSQITKTQTIEGSYMVSDYAFTEAPKYILEYWEEWNHSEQLKTGNYYRFGDYPQSVSSKTDSDVTAAPVYNDWYLGSDGKFYAKKGSVYYKVEPLKWMTLCNRQRTHFDPPFYQLFSYRAIIGEADINYYDGDTRTLKGKTISADDYKYSNIRAYLNGIENSFVTEGGTAGEYDTDWSGKGFLQTAFTPAAREYIMSTYVKDKVNGNNYFKDKIYLSSYEELEKYIIEGQGDDKEKNKKDYCLGYNRTFNTAYMGWNGGYSLPALLKDRDGKVFNTKTLKSYKDNPENGRTGFMPSLWIRTSLRDSEDTLYTDLDMGTGNW